LAKETNAAMKQLSGKKHASKVTEEVIFLPTIYQFLYVSRIHHLR